MLLPADPQANFLAHEAEIRAAINRGLTASLLLSYTERAGVQVPADLPGHSGGTSAEVDGFSAALLSGREIA